MANEIKLTVKFSKDGSIEGLEQVENAIKGISAAAKTATANIVGLRNDASRVAREVRSTQDLQRENRRSAANPRNIEEYRATQREAGELRGVLDRELGELRGAQQGLVAQRGIALRLARQVIQQLTVSAESIIGAFNDSIGSGMPGILQGVRADVSKKGLDSFRAAAGQLTGKLKTEAQAKLSQYDKTIDEAVQNAIIAAINKPPKARANLGMPWLRPLLIQSGLFNLGQFFPNEQEVRSQVMSMINKDIQNQGKRPNFSNMFKEVGSAFKLSDRLNTDEVFRNYFASIHKALLRTNGDINATFNSLLNKMKNDFGKLTIPDMKDMSNIIKDIPDVGKRLSGMLIDSANSAEQYMKMMRAGAAHVRGVAGGGIGAIGRGETRVFTEDARAQEVRNSGPFIGPPRPPGFDSKSFGEGPVKGSAAALGLWANAAQRAGAAAKSADGVIGGFTRRMGSMNLNSLFHGFLNIPNRISFAWWRLNNMFFLVSQGVNIVQGAFKGLTAGLMASNELFEMHRRLGFSISFLQEMSIAAKMTDSSLANLQVSLKNLSNSVGTAQKKAPNAQNVAFRQLEEFLGPERVADVLAKDGVKQGATMLDSLANSANRGQTALLLLQEAMKKANEEGKNTTFTAAKQLEIFTALGGKGAFANMLPVIEKMAGPEFGKAMTMMGELGLLLGKTEEESLQAAEGAEKFRETWAQVAAIPLGAITQFDKGAAPFLTLSLERVRDLVREMNIGGGGLESLGVNFGVGVLAATNKVVDRLREFVIELGALKPGEAFGNLAEDIGKLFGEKIPEVAGQVLPIMLEIGRRGALGFIEGLKSGMSGNAMSAILIGAVGGIGLGDIFEKMAVGATGAKFLGPLAPILGTALAGAVTGGLALALLNAVSNNQVVAFGQKIGKLLGDTVSASVKIVLSLFDLAKGIIPQAIKAGYELGTGIVSGINQSLRENLGVSLTSALGLAFAGFGLYKLLFAGLGTAIAAGLKGVSFASIGTAMTAAFASSNFARVGAAVAALGVSLGHIFRLAFLTPLGAMAVGIITYVFGEAAEVKAAAARGGSEAGKTWLTAFLLAIANIGDRMACLLYTSDAADE